MTRYETRIVTEIIERHDEIIKAALDNGSRAYCFPHICSDINVGDEVIVNTTAVDLSLGTGGWHFVLWNLSNRDYDATGSGHIMKARYTPIQMNVGVAEEFQTWDHQNQTLDNMPVIVAPLHSHIPAITTYIKSKREQANIVVLISDGAALPIGLSDMLRELKQKGIVNSTVSFGHAFGGDIESINIYTALLGAKNIAKADFIIVSMGPGIVGTNSKFGFTGIEVAHHLDVAKKLDGNTIGVLRASSADSRERHQAISHHAITTYSIATNLSHNIGIIEDHPLSPLMISQLRSSSIDKIHNIISMKSVGIVDLMEQWGLDVYSMGRRAREDELFFEMATCSARIALEEEK